MWEFLSNLAHNPITFVVIGFVLVYVFRYIKKGVISYSGHGLNISSQDAERQILLRQWKHARLALEASVRKLPEEIQKQLKKETTDLVIERVNNTFQEIILLNHIDPKDETYVSLKQDELLNIVINNTTNDYFTSSEFRDFFNDFIKDELTSLWLIRKTFKNNN